MKLMVINPSEKAKDYLHYYSATRNIAYYEKDEKAWITGDDANLLETLMKELKEGLAKEEYKEIYLD